MQIDRAIRELETLSFEDLCLLYRAVQRRQDGDLLRQIAEHVSLVVRTCRDGATLVALAQAMRQHLKPSIPLEVERPVARTWAIEAPDGYRVSYTERPARVRGLMAWSWWVERPVDPDSRWPWERVGCVTISTCSEQALWEVEPYGVTYGGVGKALLEAWEEAARERAA